jgi:hypothetical protein
MRKMNELTVQIENKPGTLAALGEILGKAKVNILAFIADDVGDQSRVRLVTDKPAKAKKTLERLNMAVSEEEVIGVRLRNKFGTLANVAGKLGKTNINIIRSYTGSEEESKKQLVIFVVNDLKEGIKALK